MLIRTEEIEAGIHSIVKRKCNLYCKIWIHSNIKLKSLCKQFNFVVRRIDYLDFEELNYMLNTSNKAKVILF